MASYLLRVLYKFWISSAPGNVRNLKMYNVFQYGTWGIARVFFPGLAEENFTLQSYQPFTSKCIKVCGRSTFRRVGFGFHPGVIRWIHHLELQILFPQGMVYTNMIDDDRIAKKNTCHPLYAHSRWWRIVIIISSFRGGRCIWSYQTDPSFEHDSLLAALLSFKKSFTISQNVPWTPTYFYAFLDVMKPNQRYSKWYAMTLHTCGILTFRTIPIVQVISPPYCWWFRNPANHLICGLSHYRSQVVVWDFFINSISSNDRPSMPTMPIESVSPPEELEDNWPLQAHGDALELPDAAGAKKRHLPFWEVTSSKLHGLKL